MILHKINVILKIYDIKRKPKKEKEKNLFSLNLRKLPSVQPHDDNTPRGTLLQRGTLHKFHHIEPVSFPSLRKCRISYFFLHLPINRVSKDGL